MSMSSDLLTYSIMKGPQAPHNSLPSQGSVGLIHQAPSAFPQHYNHAPVRLPPLLLIIPQKLTEHNLSSWTNQAGAQTGLGLLSAIAQMGETKDFTRDHAYDSRDYLGEGPRFLYAPTATMTSLPSVSSSGSFNSGPSSAASLTPVSSPDIKKSEMLSPLSRDATRDNGTKRRQRLGPSCDLCRSRKVKCNAEVHILTSSKIGENELQSVYGLSGEQCAQLEAGENVPIRDGLFYVMSNGKLIRFRACKSCNVKRLNCCFSNGFTKEDIISNKKKPSFKKAGVRKLKPAEELPAALPAISKALLEQREEENGRKSLCVSCRKRKVKCVFNEERQSCDVCTKKGSECVFGKSKV